MKCVEEEPVVSCTMEVVTKFIYDNMVMCFGYPLVLISDERTQFINDTIEVLMKKFIIEHRKTTAYHPWENGVVNSFNKTLHKGLLKIWNMDKDD